eukprot:COSAG06_NODE_6508_length_2901_cov_92.073876_1_plen_93_part_10
MIVCHSLLNVRKRSTRRRAICPDNQLVTTGLKATFHFQRDHIELLLVSIVGLQATIAALLVCEAEAKEEALRSVDRLRHATHSQSVSQSVSQS